MPCKAKLLIPRRNPSKTHPEDAGETGQDPQGEDGGTGFHAAGPTDVAQGGLAAAGGDSGYADVQVNCWAKCRTFLGDSLVPVIAWSGRERKQQKKSSFSSWIFFFFFAGFSHCLAVQSHGEFVILHLMPLGFPLGFITFHHYMCMCDLWTPPPGLKNPLLVSGPAEGKNMGLICTM